MRARDIQTLFADMSTGAHSPSMISQGRIGALITAKPTDRRAILEEAAGISGIHVRRHESELRLNSAENNLKKADDLKRQQEKQLENLKKQAIEASKYTSISEDIKKIEAGLYYLKLQEIKKEINITKVNTDESNEEVKNLTIRINQTSSRLDEANSKLKPLRDKNIEILSKLQRLNLEFQNLEDEEKRIRSDKDRLLKSQNTLSEDIEREKNIIFEAKSNEKRLEEEKNVLINTEKQYYDLEKQSENDLHASTEELKNEQDKLEKISKDLFLDPNFNQNLDSLKKSLSYLEKCQECIKNNDFNEVSNFIEKAKANLKKLIADFSNETNEETLNQFNKLNDKIKILQEKYANAFSKNQSIKADSIKRQERIKNIDTEIQNWKNLNFNSEKMSKELHERIAKTKIDLDNIIKLPEKIAVKKGQLMQNTSDTESRKQELSEELNKSEEYNQKISKELKEVEQKMMLARENKARAGATLDGLENRKKDLAYALKNDLSINEDNVLDSSDLKGIEDLPNVIEQEDKLDSKKNERERLGAVNLRADQETEQYKSVIVKMEKDREDLVSAISKLRSGINDLNQKGRERLLDAFEKVNKKFNEVYTKLFNGGSAKLEFVDSDDPLEAGLELLVSPPGKRLQSITLLSGGEQALTALSLIFAVFLTNPAPICVLDEVDAPLDDANVTRFCSLLDELTKITDTKFIIITHHGLTMSKMDRLYGVTMPEKGISQLVSVDLEKAEELVA